MKEATTAVDHASVVDDFLEVLVALDARRRTELGCVVVCRPGWRVVVSSYDSTNEPPARSG